jgi:cytochrome c553
MPAPPAPKTQGIESKDYKWNAQEGEKSEALKLKGDKQARRGSLRGLRCLPPAVGRRPSRRHLPATRRPAHYRADQADGRHPRRPARQPDDVSLRRDAHRSAGTGRRRRLHRELCIPLEHGKYDGKDLDKQLATGKELYEKECKECHGANGEGVKDKFYPVIAGQHYKYLLRQMTEIRDGHRRNANPDMVRIIKKYNNDQLVAISAYQSSLVMPGNMCKAKAAPAKKK